MQQKAERRRERRLARTAGSTQPYNIASRPRTTAAQQANATSSAATTLKQTIINTTTAATTTTTTTGTAAVNKTTPIVDTSSAAAASSTLIKDATATNISSSIEENVLLTQRTLVENDNSKQPSSPTPRTKITLDNYVEFRQSSHNLDDENCTNNTPSTASLESPLVAMQPDFENEHTIHQVENFASAEQQQQQQQQQNAEQQQQGQQLNSSNDLIEPSCVGKTKQSEDIVTPMDIDSEVKRQRSQETQEPLKLTESGEQQEQQQQQQQQTQQQQQEKKDSEQKDAAKIVPLNSGTVVA